MSDWCDICTIKLGVEKKFDKEKAMAAPPPIRYHTVRPWPKNIKSHNLGGRVGRTVSALINVDAPGCGTSVDEAWGGKVSSLGTVVSNGTYCILIRGQCFSADKASFYRYV